MCKSSSKWTEDVKVRPEAMKLPEGREALKDVELGGKIRGVDVALKAQRTEAEANK